MSNYPAGLSDRDLYFSTPAENPYETMDAEELIEEWFEHHTFSDEYLLEAISEALCERVDLQKQLVAHLISGHSIDPFAGNWKKFGTEVTDSLEKTARRFMVADFDENGGDF